MPGKPPKCADSGVAATAEDNCSTCAQCGLRTPVNLSDIGEPPSVLWKSPNATEALGGVLVSVYRARQMNQTFHAKRTTNEQIFGHYLLIFNVNDTTARLAWSVDEVVVTKKDTLLSGKLVREFLNLTYEDGGHYQSMHDLLFQDAAAKKQLDEILEDTSNEVAVDVEVGSLKVWVLELGDRMLEDRYETFWRDVSPSAIQGTYQYLWFIRSEFMITALRIVSLLNSLMALPEGFDLFLEFCAQKIEVAMQTVKQYMHEHSGTRILIEQPPDPNYPQDDSPSPIPINRQSSFDETGNFHIQTQPIWHIDDLSTEGDEQIVPDDAPSPYAQSLPSQARPASPESDPGRGGGGVLGLMNEGLSDPDLAEASALVATMFPFIDDETEITEVMPSRSPNNPYHPALRQVPVNLPPLLTARPSTPQNRSVIKARAVAIKQYLASENLVTRNQENYNQLRDWIDYGYRFFDLHWETFYWQSTSRQGAQIDSLFSQGADFIPTPRAQDQAVWDPSDGTGVAREIEMRVPTRERPLRFGKFDAALQLGGGASAPSETGEGPGASQMNRTDSARELLEDVTSAGRNSSGSGGV